MASHKATTMEWSASLILISSFGLLMIFGLGL